MEEWGGMLLIGTLGADRINYWAGDGELRVRTPAAGPRSPFPINWGEWTTLIVIHCGWAVYKSRDGSWKHNIVSFFKISHDYFGKSHDS